MSGDDALEPAPEPALEQSALARVLRWPPARVFAMLREDALSGSLGVAELDRRLALRAFDLAAGELLAAASGDREGRRRAARVLCQAAMRALLTPGGAAHPEALRLLDRAAQGFAGRDGLRWGALAELAQKAHGAHTARSGEEPSVRAAAGFAWAASHLALGDPARESGRAAFDHLLDAFVPAAAPASLAVALSHLERELGAGEVAPKALVALADAAS